MIGWEEFSTFPPPEIITGTGRVERQIVVLERVDATVGLQLAERLLAGGYSVVSRTVASECQAVFERSGGRLLAGSDLSPGEGWVIDHEELVEPRMDIVVSMLPHGLEGRRPRVEVGSDRGAGSATERRTLAMLWIHPAGATEEVLEVRLVAGRGGGGLTVSGDRRLFEHALPLLTTLSDRVLYAVGS